MSPRFAIEIHNYDADVAVLASRSDGAFTPVSADQLSIVRRMGIAVGSAADLLSIDHARLIIDGMVGYSLRGAPRGDTARLIEWANASARRCRR